MRLKLVLCASSLAAIVGAGLCIAVLLAFFSSAKLFAYPSLLLVSTFLLPTAAIVFASIFVYRHTSRRRKLQAFMTAILATTLTIAFLVLASILSARREEPPQPTSPVVLYVRHASACRQDH
jgi:purine-cytosine permease-like protein